MIHHGSAGQSGPESRADLLHRFVPRPFEDGQRIRHERGVGSIEHVKSLSNRDFRPRVTPFQKAVGEANRDIHITTQPLVYLESVRARVMVWKGGRGRRGALACALLMASCHFARPVLRSDIEAGAVLNVSVLIALSTVNLVLAHCDTQAWFTRARYEKRRRPE